MTASDQKFIAALREHGPMSEEQICERAGISRSYVSRIRLKLAKMGVIRMTGKTVQSAKGVSVAVWDLAR